MGLKRIRIKNQIGDTLIHVFYLSDLYLKIINKNGKIYIFYLLVISDKFIQFYAILTAWIRIHLKVTDLDTHKNSGSGSRGPTLCGSGPIRIRNTVGNSIKTLIMWGVMFVKSKQTATGAPPGSVAHQAPVDLQPVCSCSSADVLLSSQTRGRRTYVFKLQLYYSLTPICQCCHLFIPFSLST